MPCAVCHAVTPTFAGDLATPSRTLRCTLLGSFSVLSVSLMAGGARRLGACICHWHSIRTEIQGATRQQLQTPMCIAIAAPLLTIERAITHLVARALGCVRWLHSSGRLRSRVSIRGVPSVFHAAVPTHLPTDSCVKHHVALARQQDADDGCHRYPKKTIDGVHLQSPQTCCCLLPGCRLPGYAWRHSFHQLCVSRQQADELHLPVTPLMTN